MSSSIKTIKLMSILSIVFLVITYLITVNMESGFIKLNTIWVSNTLLLTIFGGVFASALVVLFCEVSKYMINKKDTETQLFIQGVYLYQALFQMKHNILDYQSHPNKQIPPNLLEYTANMIKPQVFFIHGADYVTFKKNNEITIKHKLFKKNSNTQYYKIESGCNALRCAILEERIANHENDKLNPDYITSSNPRVSIVLENQIKDIEPLIKDISMFLKAIDDNCRGRYNWNSFKTSIQKNYVPLTCINDEIQL